MNIAMIPSEVRNDIEDQSLGILEAVADQVVVIGGWAVRAVLGPVHGRFSLDVDAVAAPEGIDRLHDILADLGFELWRTDWGIRMFAPYEPRVDVEGLDPDLLKSIEIRVEVSGPRMYDVETKHYFEFPLAEAEEGTLPSLPTPPGKTPTRAAGSPPLPRPSSSSFSFNDGGQWPRTPQLAKRRPGAS